MIALEFLFMLLIGGVTAYVASTKGRNVVGWFVVGFFFNCIGLVLILVIGDEGAQNDLKRENRRLREKLRMDRTVADRRHRETEKRLEVHDVALGVDTSTPAERIEEHAEEPMPGGPLAEESNTPSRAANVRFYQVHWHYALDSEQQGPVSFEELRDLWIDGVLNSQSLVWNKRLSNWKSIGQVRDLEGELRA